MRTLLGALSIVVIVAGPLSDVATAAPADQADGVEVFARDVFWINGLTLRNPTADTPPGAPLFNVAGVNMDVTWGQWSAASAQSSVRVAGGAHHPRSDVRLELAGLIPGGHYSVFWGTLGPDSEQPLCPGVERTLPLDAVKLDAAAADANSFVAGADGTAAYRGAVANDLFDATQVFFSIVYHLDADQSTYPFPNLGEYRTQGPNCRSSFGEDAMRQLLVLQKW